LKNTERNAKLKVIIKRLRKPEENLTSSSEKRPSDRKIISEQPRSKNCKILRQLRKPNSSSFLKLGITT